MSSPNWTLLHHFIREVNIMPIAGFCKSVFRSAHRVVINLLVLAVFGLTLFCMLLQSKPVAESADVPSAEAMSSIKRRLSLTVVNYPRSFVAFRGTDLHSLASMASYTLKPLLFGVDLNHTKLKLNTSLAVVPGTRYLNLSCSVEAHPQQQPISGLASVVRSEAVDETSPGLILERCELGGIAFSGEDIRWAVNLVAGMLLGKDVEPIIERFLNTSRLDRGVLWVRQVSRPQLKQMVSRSAELPLGLSALLSGGQSLTLAQLQPYFNVIESVRTESGAKPVSLTRFIQPLFAEANRRAQRADPALENRAAFWALMLGLADAKFTALLGLETLPIRSVQQGTLGGRKDLALHFLYSAAIKAFSKAQVSFSVGELKEILDSGIGGSGFSFQDLAADRAGVHFADVVLSEKSAAESQWVLAHADSESSYFVLDQVLPEGLTEREFRDHFDSVKSSAYHKVIQRIDQDLLSLPLYLRVSG
ncbi:hypothetical protein [Oleiphilus messinensis]|nr:hypothetical protein [Oleiphilus messinensis]